MFHSISENVKAKMHELEAIDAKDRIDGTPRMQRLRQIPPETGRFISLLAMSSPPGRCVEIGTSAGYSTIWLALACREVGRKLITYENLPEKVILARETIAAAQMLDTVKLVHGDALEHLTSLDEIAFCFLDAEKEIYLECYELLIPRLVSGGLLVADNAINHRKTLASTINRAESDRRVDAMVVPIGKGELVCRKI